MNPVSFWGNTLNLAEQLLSARRSEKHLGLPKVKQFSSGFAPADPSLMAAETPEQAFQLQIVLGESGDSVAVEQFLSIQFPTPFERTQEPDLCSVDLPTRMSLLDQGVDLLGNLLAAEFLMSW
jgi:hypothetical protein